jgi:hypothetical protein
MDEETAKQVVGRIQAASFKCNASLRTVMSNESLGHVQVYGRLVGNFMAYSLTNVLTPLWRHFPNLEPPEMRGAYVERAPTLSEDSQRALREFLAEAKAAVDFTRSSLTSEEAETLLGFGKLPELEEAIAAIEQFLNFPRVRDEGKQ